MEMTQINKHASLCAHYWLQVSRECVRKNWLAPHPKDRKRVIEMPCTLWKCRECGAEKWLPILIQEDCMGQGGCNYAKSQLRLLDNENMD